MNYERSFFLNADSSGLGHNYSPEFASMPPRNDGFENADIMNSIISLPRRTKTYRFLIASVDGRKWFENASVDADICIRFCWIKNGGIRKRISVDVA